MESGHADDRVTAADALIELDDALRGAGIELCFAELKDPVKDKLRRFGLLARFGDAVFFPTIEAAVSAYRERTGTDQPEGVGPTTLATSGLIPSGR